ncbi:MAG TPA: hypothetical protein VD931_19540, partial [Baekduia sp.]|nr:hypothetical protein [Baekduia sp.]
MSSTKSRPAGAEALQEFRELAAARPDVPVSAGWVSQRACDYAVEHQAEIAAALTQESYAAREAWLDGWRAMCRAREQMKALGNEWRTFVQATGIEVERPMSDLERTDAFKAQDFRQEGEAALRRYVEDYGVRLVLPLA